MTEKKVRRKLFKVAKELNLSHQTIIEFLEKKEHPVSGLNTPITDEIYDEILLRFSQEKLQADKLAKRKKELVKDEEIVSQEETEAIMEISDEIIPELSDAKKSEKEISDVDKILPEEKEVEKDESIIETKMGKTPEIAEVEEKEIQKETEIEKEKSEKIEIKPKVGDIIEHPIAKKFLEDEAEKQKKKVEKKKKILKKIKDEGKKEKKDKEEIKLKAKEEEIIPRRIRAVEKEEIETLDILETFEVDQKSRKKKEKKKKIIDEDLTDKEKRRRKALEMIRREGKKSKIIRPMVDVDSEEEELETELLKKRTRKKKEVDQQEVEDTLKKTLASMQDSGTGKKKRKKIKDTGDIDVEDEKKIISVTEFITVQDLANLIDVPVSEIIKKCLELGLMVSLNQRLEMDLIKLIAEDYGFEVGEEEEYASDFIEDLIDNTDAPEKLQPRHPVVTVMGHVDHGKTSLLDYIRKTNVVAGESGGITQHIGAYVVDLDNNRHITFLDTPGHEAFTAMRSRGAQVTDIVVLVVAADDRVMPQTEEAIDHARAAGVPIIIAINKVDKSNADSQAIRKQLADKDILVEDWGGKYQVVDVSAKSGQGINELLEKVILEAEILELKANPDKSALGVVIESRLDKGKGPVATILIQQGTLKIGDDFIVGQYYGRIRALLNERNQSINEAGPSIPAQILGIDGVPEAGDKLIVIPDEKKVREIAQHRQQLKREQDFKKIRLLTLDEISKQIQEGKVKELKVIVKADVDGSAQALTDSLQKVTHEDVAVKVVRRAVGPISESDIMLATASKAIIIGFHVRPTIKAKKLAEKEQVDIRLYKVIYDAIDEVKKALEGLLEPEEREEAIGLVEIREIYKVSRLGTIAGCYVLNGKITRNSNIRLIRNDVEIYEGKLTSLKRFKEDTREVSSGYECGLMIENYNDLKVGDIIEAFEVVQEKRTLES